MSAVAIVNIAIYCGILKINYYLLIIVIWHCDCYRTLLLTIVDEQQ